MKKEEKRWGINYQNQLKLEILLLKTESCEADTIVNALGSKKNLFDDSKLTVPFVYVGDCSGERTADISAAIRSGYQAGNEI